MMAVLDVHYEAEAARAACVTFESWSDRRARHTFRVEVPGIRPYRPGHLFERELSPLLAVLEETGEEFSHIIVDGYVHLKDNRMGLGAHLHEALPYPLVVIGVAKNPLSIADRFEAVHRGRSTKPLYVSAIGCDLGDATTAVAGMHGPYRIPTLLRLADRLARVFDSDPTFKR